MLERATYVKRRQIFAIAVEGLIVELCELFYAQRRLRQRLNTCADL